MIVGIKKQNTSNKDQNILKEIQKIKYFFGIDYHYLEKLMRIN